MPKKPNPIELGAEAARRKNPKYGHDVLEAIINETPELRDYLIKRNLVEVVEK